MKIVFCKECESIVKLKVTAQWGDCGKCGGALLRGGHYAHWGLPSVILSLDFTSQNNLLNHPTEHWGKNEIALLAVPTTNPIEKKSRCPLSLTKP